MATMKCAGFDNVIARAIQPANRLAPQTSDWPAALTGGNVWRGNNEEQAMRTILLASVVTLALGGTAFAQMCGGGSLQQTATTA